MIVRVLGCSGGEARGRRATSVLLGDRVLIDAGSAASTLDPQEQSRIEHVLLTHAHLDHIKELPFLCENRVISNGGPLRVHATPGALTLLHEHLLNNRVYPDWTRVPEAAPVLVMDPIEPARPFHLADMDVTAVALVHPGGSFAYVVEGRRGAFIWAGDTGPSPHLRDEVVRRGVGVRALALEVSLPDRLAELARLTGHLTPSMLREEIEVLGVSRPEVWIHHLKPTLREEILREIEGLGLEGLRILEEGDRIELDLGVDHSFERAL